MLNACTDIRLNEPLGYLIKLAGLNLHTIPKIWGTTGIGAVTTGLATVY